MLSFYIQKNETTQDQLVASVIWLWKLKALERKICKTFQVPQSDSWEQVCDKIRTLWIAYQLEDKPKEFYTKSNDEASKSSRRTNSYWSYALGLCDLQPKQEADSQFIRIYHYRRKISKILSDHGFQKYTQFVFSNVFYP